MYSKQLTQPCSSENPIFKTNNTITVVIPAYNEEDRIAPILDGLVKSERIDEVIVIFDGDDRTPQVANSFLKHFSPH